MVAEVDPDTLSALEAALLNAAGNVPLHNRFRALFTLKALKSNDAVKIISKGECIYAVLLLSPRMLPTKRYFQLSGFSDESALLKHELAYCLGQTKNTSALPVLESVLADEKEDPMVRHEVCEFAYPYALVPDV